VFCFGPLPNECARVRITSVKQRYAVAELIELLSASAARAEPFCPVFGACGGCQLQHLEYAAQLSWKRQLVENALRRIGGFAHVAVAQTIGMGSPRAYRNKMALVVEHGATPALGFYRQRSHEIVPIDACPIVAPQLDADLARLHALRDTAPVREMLGDASHLVVRSSAATGESVLTATTARESSNARRAAPALLRELPKLAGVGNSYDLPNANAILGRRCRRLAGDAEIEEAIGALRYRVSARSFFQVNVEMVGKIFEFLRPWLTPAGSIVDFYCGVGTFSLFFAKHGWKVVGIEQNAHAIAEAIANARLNELESCARFEIGPVEQMVGAPRVQRALRSADVVFLDPPRKGCDEATLRAIADARVPALWYLSCDAATLARDSKFLVANGYRLGIVQPFDMFPQTGHVETFVRLEYSGIVNRTD
jgi:23S rRNA (uracil1939-C5)-methyltransferase